MLNKYNIGNTLMHKALTMEPWKVINNLYNIFFLNNNKDLIKFSPSYENVCVVLG